MQSGALPLRLPGLAEMVGYELPSPSAALEFRYNNQWHQETMSKQHRRHTETGRPDADDILPEYDFSRARPNKYASRYAAGSIVVVLEPDVAAVFPSAGQANEAPRALAGIIQKHRPRRAASGRSA